MEAYATVCHNISGVSIFMLQKPDGLPDDRICAHLDIIGLHIAISGVGESNSAIADSFEAAK